MPDEPQIIRFQASPTDRKRLDSIMRHMEAVSLSDVMRRIIRAEYERVIAKD